MPGMGMVLISRFVNIFFSVLVCRLIFAEIKHCRTLLLLAYLCSRKQRLRILVFAAESKEKPRKRGNIVAFELCLLQGLCKLHILIYYAVKFLLDCLHTAIIKELKYGIWTLLKRFRHLHLARVNLNSNILYFVLLL